MSACSTCGMIGTPEEVGNHKCIDLSRKTNLQTPTRCECGSDIFRVEVLDEEWHNGDDLIGKTDEFYCTGVLYECMACGYIHTAWNE